MGGFWIRNSEARFGEACCVGLHPLLSSVPQEEVVPVVCRLLVLISFGGGVPARGGEAKNTFTAHVMSVVLRGKAARG